MKRRKIGSITPIWNQEMFLGPHFDMLSSLDRNVVVMQKGPLPNYDRHGIGDKPDFSEQILRKLFPKVEIFQAEYDPVNDFGCELYNECLRKVQDCDIVFRLDPDMFFLEKDWKALLKLIDSTDFDSYRMDFRNDSVNYYMSWDYEHGIKDAQEYDPLAVNPHIMFTNVLDYPEENHTIIKIPGWVCHHMRGWNKPKSTPDGWHLWPEHKDLPLDFGDEMGMWIKAPREIKDKLELWHFVLNQIHKDGKI
jgi:hypothetical protein